MARRRLITALVVVALVTTTIIGTYFLATGKLNIFCVLPVGGTFPCPGTTAGIFLAGSGSLGTTTTNIVYAPNGTSVTLWLQLPKQGVYGLAVNISPFGISIANSTYNCGSGQQCVLITTIPASSYNNATGILSTTISLVSPPTILQCSCNIPSKLFPGTFSLNIFATNKSGYTYNAYGYTLNYYSGSLNPRIAGTLPTVGYATRPISLSLTPSGSVAPYTVTYNWGDGTPATILSNIPSGTPANTGHTYASIGIYALNATITDTAGRNTNLMSSLSIASISSAPPSPVFTPLLILLLIPIAVIRRRLKR